MNENMIWMALTGMLIFCILVIAYQQFVFRRGTQTMLQDISRKLQDILENDSDEKIMVFTDNKKISLLCGEINRLLLDRQKIRAEYRKQEMSSKKMLANISHDIKTPLTVILGYLEMLRLNGEKMEEEQKREAMQKVEKTAEQVMDLINQFFSLAKLEAGDMDMEISKIHINELCREGILGFYDILLQKDFEVDIHIPEQEIYVWGNEDAIHRIFMNLISNAIRYGSHGKYIGLTLRENKKNAFIDVIDHGAGIKKEFAQNVFTRLYTMEDSRSRNMQGSGLGLTIAKGLARQLGGDLYLDSEPYERTIFTVELKKC